MRRIETLLAAMTTEEKIGQLSMAAGTGIVTGPRVRRALEAEIRVGRIGSLLNIWGVDETRSLQRLAVEESRLGIPLLFTLDVVHGFRTIFPVPLAEACLFDADAWERSACAAATEAAADGIALTFAPMIDVARDPRWGRIVESPGEDPWVAAQFGVAKTRGFQGADPGSVARVAATAKHLCAYGAVTAGREYASVDLAERTVHEVYLPPFAAAVASGVAAIMPALTDIAGVPMSGHRPLLTDWLRGRLGYQGVVISDYNAIAELCAHGVAEDEPAAAALALDAGVDIDMVSGVYERGLPLALKRGLVTLTQLDASVRRVLTLKERLGLFDDPYRRGAGGEAGAKSRDSVRELAREVARRAIVLLTHRGDVLPLPHEARRIALIGPLAAAADSMLGPWAAAGRAEDAVSILEGLRAALPRCRIDCVPGVDSVPGIDSVAGVSASGDRVHGIAAAVECCRSSEHVILCLGEDRSMSGEAASRADPGLPAGQRALAEAVLDVGKPVVVLLSSGRPLLAPWLFGRAHAVLATWFLGTQAGHAIADVLTGRFNPAGKLALSWPRHGGQLPLFYAQRPTGRPSRSGERFSSSYLDVPATPQFPFGHGLSYSRFTLEDLQCTPREVNVTSRIEVSVSVRNEGAVRGEAKVFLFVHDVVATIARPVLELKGVRSAALDPGEHCRLRWTLPVESLAFVGEDLEPLLEPGRFEIHVGQSADPEGFLTQSVELLS